MKQTIGVIMLKISLHLFTYITICSCNIRMVKFQSNTSCNENIELSLNKERERKAGSAVACAMLCTEMAGCGGFLYYVGTKACYGVDADSPVFDACALLGTSFYKNPALLTTATSPSITTTSPSTTTSATKTAKATTPPPQTSTIPPITKLAAQDWDYIGRSCYYLPWLGVMLPFYDALDYCSVKGGHIMQLETQAENDAMKTYLMNNYDTSIWWIGLSDVATEGDWLWVADGTKLDFNDWIGPPDGDRDANFAILEKTVGWKNISRYGPYAIICEKAEC